MSFRGAVRNRNAPSSSHSAARIRSSTEQEKLESFEGKNSRETVPSSTHSADEHRKRVHRAYSMADTPLWKKLRNVVFAAILLPLIAVGTVLWWLTGRIVTTSLPLLAFLQFGLMLALYIPLQIRIETLIVDWPIVMFFLSAVLICIQKNTVVHAAVVVISMTYTIPRAILLEDAVSNEANLLVSLVVVCVLCTMSLSVAGQRWWIPAELDPLESIERTLYDAHIGTEYYSMTKVAGLGTVHVPYSGSLILNAKSKTPQCITNVVLLHGYGAGNGFWALNLAPLSKSFNVFAVEWKGVGRSDRPKFKPKTWQEADDFFVDAIEEWRTEMQIDNFVLCGHSMGAMFSTSYALKYPHRVKHLVLLSPCGVGHRPQSNPSNFPLMFRMIRKLWNKFTPMGLVRFAGPMGKSLLSWLVSKRIEWMPESSALRTGNINLEHICEYTYQNWAGKACGEYAMHTHLHPGAFGKRPLCDRLVPGQVDMPVTFLYGGGPDWMNFEHGQKVVQQLEGTQYAELKKVPLAGHQVFLDNPEMFNRMLKEAILECDEATNRSITEKTGNTRNGTQHGPPHKENYGSTW